MIFIVGLGIPGLQLDIISEQSVFTYGVVALVLVYSAYVAEVYRAGIDSVHASQLAGARSLGLSQWQSMRYVVLPQAIRRVIPPLLNDFIGLQKDTALVGLLGLVEVARAAENYASSTFNFAGYTMAALLFIAVTIPLARATDYLIERDRRRMRASAGLALADPILRLQGVRKSHGEAEVLRGIDLDVAAHEVVCLIGASGCGKSTLLKCANLV